MAHSAARALLLGAVFFGPLAFGAVEAWAWAAVSTAIFAAAFLCSLDPRSLRARPVDPTLLPAVLAVVAIGAVQSLSHGSILEPAGGPSTVDPLGTESAVMRWAAYAALIWCVPRLFVGRDGVRRLIAAVFAVGIAVAAMGIVLHAHDKHMLYGWRAISGNYDPFGPYFNRDHAASVLVMAEFCGIGLFWDSWARHGRAAGRSEMIDLAARQSLVALGLGLILAGLLKTQSRGAVGALILAGAATALWGTFAAGRRMYWPALSAGIALTALWFSPVAERLTPQRLESAIYFRFGLYSAAVDLIADFPLLGVGLGGFGHAYHPYKPAGVDGVVEHAHNDWLQLSAETGLLGACLFTAGVGAYLFGRLQRSSSDPLTAALAGAAGGFIIHSTCDFNLQIPANAMLFFSIVAGLGGLANTRPDSGSPGPSWAMPAVIGAASLFILARSAPSAAASWDALVRKGEGESLHRAAVRDADDRQHYLLARRLATSGRLREALAAGESALHVDPANPAYRSHQAGLLERLGRTADGRQLRLGANL